MRSSANWRAEKRERQKQSLPPVFLFAGVGERIMAISPKGPARMGMVLDLVCHCLVLEFFCVLKNVECEYIIIFQ